MEERPRKRRRAQCGSTREDAIQLESDTDSDSSSSCFFVQSPSVK
jgi:hypothetical protein